MVSIISRRLLIQILSRFIILLKAQMFFSHQLFLSVSSGHVVYAISTFPVREICCRSATFFRCDVFLLRSKSAKISSMAVTADSEVANAFALCSPPLDDIPFFVGCPNFFPLALSPPPLPLC